MDHIAMDHIAETYVQCSRDSCRASYGINKCTIAKKGQYVRHVICQEMSEMCFTINETGPISSARLTDSPRKIEL